MVPVKRDHPIERFFVHAGRRFLYSKIPKVIIFVTGAIAVAGLINVMLSVLAYAMRG